MNFIQYLLQKSFFYCFCFLPLSELKIIKLKKNFKLDFLEIQYSKTSAENILKFLNFGSAVT